MIATLICFQASDISLRIASVDTHFAVGTVLQALPLMLIALIVAVRRSLLSGDRIAGRSWGIIAGYGVLQFFTGNLLFYAAVQMGGLSIASPSVQSQAIWAVVLGGVFLGERISRMMIYGILLFIAGLVTMAGFKSAGLSLSGDWIWAIVCGVLGGLAWAGGSALQRTQLRRGVPLSYILAIGSAAGILLLNLMIILYYGTSAWQNTDLTGAVKVLAAGCFNGLAVASVSQALKTIEISKVIPVISLSIVFNTLVGGLVFNEYLNAGSIVGMLVLFLGVIIVQEPKFRFLKSGGVRA
ncbi:hypothetical protein GCM10010911_39790 [Paenibacillus nasutitermitis]|uniref:EamA domain-containing protein n=1 Tax=Paenibacillus nasutitermitis TaxID=1652958 RepID=A0A916Z5T0_9BACL|nr:hypothetical protein GCM10010911_39790 [Paenibacillus nasutitermitis]